MGERGARPFAGRLERRTRTPVRRLPPEDRVRTFDEVTLPYSPADAQREAARCIQCARPYCEEGCPARSPIRTWIRLVARGDLAGAYRALRVASNLPAICGRVCPVERQCEGACVMGRKGEPVAIGMLERFVADDAIARVLRAERRPSSGRRVAVIGSGPAGLTAGGDLAELGHEVTIFEALPVLGGVLAWGIPRFTLPRQPLEAELARLARMGVVLQPGTHVDVDSGLLALFRAGFRAVVLCVGAGRARALGIPGEGLPGAYEARDFLMLASLGRVWRAQPVRLPASGARVAVVGGGDTALDVARTAVRLGAREVLVIYRRTEAEMPARADERARAWEEGVVLRGSTVPLAVVGDVRGRVIALECLRTVPGPRDATGRPRPVPVPASRFRLPVDAVVSATGFVPDPWIARLGVPANADGTVRADADGRTSRAAIFAAGDVVRGPDRVVTAMADAKRAARAAHEYLARPLP